jgi:hypothetical protein
MAVLLHKFEEDELHRHRRGLEMSPAAVKSLLSRARDNCEKLEPASGGDARAINRIRRFMAEITVISEQRDNLTAYLDGELDDAATQDIEQVLAVVKSPATKWTAAVARLGHARRSAGP